MKDKILNGYKKLSLAIFEQSIKDYMAIERGRVYAKEDKLDLDEIVDFFYSEWFELLVDIDRDVFLDRLERAC